MESFEEGALGSGESRDLRECSIRKGPATAATLLVRAGITATLIGVLARHAQTD